MGSAEVRWESGDRQGACVLRPDGELTATCYREFTDTLIKFAVEEPRALIVVLDDLRVAAEPLYTAFSSARTRVGQWPGVPILLVSHSPSRRKWLQRRAINRFTPVFASVSGALRAVRDAPPRRRVRLDLDPVGSCGQRARRFLEETCVGWDIPEVRVDALLIVTELVENAFLHSRVEADIQLRLELSDQLFTIAVGDADPHEAMLREPGGDGRGRYGLRIVARLARAWGCSPRWPSGKVVWAVLPTGRQRDRLYG